jgi:hypothetical protein
VHQIKEQRLKAKRYTGLVVLAPVVCRGGGAWLAARGEARIYLCGVWRMASALRPGVGMVGSEERVRVGVGSGGAVRVVGISG